MASISSDGKTLNVLMGAFMIPVFIFGAWMVYYDTVKPLVCVEHAKVASILSIQYRSATILLDNGQTREVNQASLKPGDNFCLRSERQEKH